MALHAGVAPFRLVMLRPALILAQVVGISALFGPDAFLPLTG